MLSAEPADPPAPGSLRFTLVQDLRVIVEGEGFKSVFHLDDKEVLAPAQRTWRRISGRPDGRADKLGPGTIDLLLAVDDFVETYGRDVGLTPGELARRIAAHAAKAGITDRLDESGPLREACERLLTFWRQRKRYAPG